MTSLLGVLQRVIAAAPVDGNQTLLDSLQTESVGTSDTNESFRHIASNYDITSFYETIPTDRLPLGKVLDNGIQYTLMLRERNIYTQAGTVIVSHQSATLGLTNTRELALDVNHAGSVKMSSRSDTKYTVIAATLRRIVDEVLLRRRHRLDPPTQRNP